jgi:uncharacterized protein (DUF433 family)
VTIWPARVADIEDTDQVVKTVGSVNESAVLRDPDFSIMRKTASAVCACVLRYHDDVQQFDRITMDPEVMGGKPCIRGMRVTVGMIVEALAAGRTIEQLLADFPYIEEPDIRQALGFAARLAQGHEIRLAS